MAIIHVTDDGIEVLEGGRRIWVPDDLPRQEVYDPFGVAEGGASWGVPKAIKIPDMTREVATAVVRERLIDARYEEDLAAAAAGASPAEIATWPVMRDLVTRYRAGDAEAEALLAEHSPRRDAADMAACITEKACAYEKRVVEAKRRRREALDELGVIPEGASHIDVFAVAAEIAAAWDARDEG